MNAIETHALTVHIGGTPRLDGVTLQIPKGQWVSIVGPNGAGKSTFLKALVGLIPTHNAVHIEHIPIERMPAKTRAQTIAWMGQNETISDDITVYDLVLLGRIPHQTWYNPTKQTDHVMVETALRQVNAWQWQNRRIHTLSGGEKQRVLTARLLAVDAPILLLDEPLMHLDLNHQTEWVRLMRQLTLAGKTIVTVLHELHIALCSDSIAIFNHGRLVHMGNSHAPRTHACLEHTFEHAFKLVAYQTQWLVSPNI